MKKLLGILLFLCMICTLPVQPALAAYGYTSDAELENECGITFDPNGGEGSMEPLWHNGSFKLPECGFTAPEGCRFAGWRWNRELKQPGDAVYLGGVGVAVAVWEEIPVETTEAPVETTEAPVETTEAPVETTDAPTTTEAQPDEDTSSEFPWLIVAAGVAVAVIAAAVVIIIAKKKK